MEDIVYYAIRINVGCCKGFPDCTMDDCLIG